MSLRLNILNLINTYAPNSKWSRTSISTRMFGSGKVLARIESGGDITTGTYEDAVWWLSCNWPTDLAWPAAVPRPAVQSVSPASSLKEEVA